jgi:DNA-binding MarR family transcriptional regulator
MVASPITIELTQAQVEQIMRRSSHATPDGVSGVLQALTDRDLASSFSRLSTSPRLSRSLLLGLLVLTCFPTDGDSRTVTDVANQLGLSPSTTHRYMSTLLAVGLLEQDARTRRYRVPVTSSAPR